MYRLAQYGGNGAPGAPRRDAARRARGGAAPRLRDRRGARAPQPGRVRAARGDRLPGASPPRGGGPAVEPLGGRLRAAPARLRALAHGPPGGARPRRELAHVPHRRRRGVRPRRGVGGLAVTPIAAYLEELAGLLPWTSRRRIVAEVGAHLHEAAALRRAGGEGPDVAELGAVTRFGA